MNFNLVSDQENGHRYDCHFAEEIVIEKDSEVYLNFAQLSREANIKFNKPQTITFSVSDGAILPTKSVDDLGTVTDSSFSGSADIPAGIYTPQELQTKIQNLIIAQFSESGKGAYYTSNPEDFLTVKLGLSDLALNRYVNINASEKPENFVDFSLDAVNKFNGELDLTSSVVSYQKTDQQTISNRLEFDNYGAAPHPIFSQCYDTTSQPTLEGHIMGSVTVGVLSENSQEGSTFVGFLGIDGAVLPNQAGSTPPSTIGAVTPVLRTVKYPVEQIDENVLPAGERDSSNKTMLIPDPDFDNPIGNNYYQGFKISVSSIAGSVTPAICYPTIVSPVSNRSGVMNYEFVSGSITGLAASTQFTLVSATSAGPGSGFVLKATSDAGGEIAQLEIEDATAIIENPGGGLATGYTLESEIELTHPSGTGTLTIGVSQLSHYGPVVAFQWNDVAVTSHDPTSDSLTRGSGFVGGTDCLVIQSITPQIQNSTGDFGTLATSAVAMIPQCYLGVEFGGQDGKIPFNQDSMNVYMAIDSGGNFPRGWGTQDKAIAGMRRIAQLDYPAGDLPRKIALQLYTKSSDKTNFTDTSRIYFKVIDVGLDPDRPGGPLELYDSAVDQQFFDRQFLTAVPVTTVSTMKLQFPFTSFVSVQGRDRVVVKQYNPYDLAKSTGTNNENRPLNLRDFQLTFSQELEEVLQAQELVLYPTTDALDRIANVTIDNTIAPILNASYYVVIEELPLRNYKNYIEVRVDGKGKNKKGYRKNILANIPLPFEAVANKVEQDDGTTKISGLYNPPKKIISSLLNQRISTNQFSVRVHRMSDDTEASEITSSVINFTVTSPESRLAREL